MSEGVIISLIGSFATIIGIGLTGYVNHRLGTIHKQLNSRMDQLLQEARASGNIQGRKELKEEQKESKEI